MRKGLNSLPPPTQISDERTRIGSQILNLRRLRLSLLMTQGTSMMVLIMIQSVEAFGLHLSRPEKIGGGVMLAILLGTSLAFVSTNKKITVLCQQYKALDVVSESGQTEQKDTQCELQADTRS